MWTTALKSWISSLFAIEKNISSCIYGEKYPSIHKPWGKCRPNGTMHYSRKTCFISEAKSIPCTMPTKWMELHKGCRGPLQLTGAQQTLADRCSPAADIIYWALRPHSQAKLFPREPAIKEPDKETPVHQEIQGKGPACSSHGCSSYMQFWDADTVSISRVRRLCLGSQSSWPCVHPFTLPGQRGSLLWSSCMGPSASTEFLLSARILPLW